MIEESDGKGRFLVKCYNLTGANPNLSSTFLPYYTLSTPLSEELSSRTPPTRSISNSSAP